MAPHAVWGRLGWMALVVALVGTSSARAERSPLKIYIDSKSFEQIAHKRGVTVYKHRNSDIIRIGATGRIQAPPGQVQKALLDYQRQIGQIDRLSEAKVITRNPRELWVYQRLNLPIISDRDFVLRVRNGQDGKTRWVSYWSVTGKGPPPRSGVVRVRHHKGSWELKPAQQGKATDVRYQVTIDLAGSLPKWMARAGAGRELPDLFNAICRLSQPRGRNRCH